MEIEGMNFDPSLKSGHFGRMKPPEPKEIIEEKDSDGDGLLSSEEFGIPEKMFNDIDANGDGLLDEEEMLNHRDEMKQKILGEMGPLFDLMGGKDEFSLLDVLFGAEDSNESSSSLYATGQDGDLNDSDLKQKQIDFEQKLEDFKSMIDPKSSMDDSRIIFNFLEGLYYQNQYMKSDGGNSDLDVNG